RAHMSAQTRPMCSEKSNADGEDEGGDDEGGDKAGACDARGMDHAISPPLETCPTGRYVASAPSTAGAGASGALRSCLPTSSRMARVPASPSRGLASRKT